MYHVPSRFLADGFSHNGRVKYGDPLGWVLGDYWLGLAIGADCW